MSVSHLEVLVEEPSMEAFLQGLLPRLLAPHQTFAIHAFQGKTDLLGKLESRLRGYSAWLPRDWRIVVAVDRDDDDCRELKIRLDDLASRAGLRTRRHNKGESWQIVNRIAIEELEAWYFGDWEAVRSAYPKAPEDVPRRQSFRHADAILGGTWEAFERVLKGVGYFKNGLTKIEAARAIGRQVDPARNTSPSFLAFSAAIVEVSN